MEKCGCRQCVLMFGKNAMDADGYVVEDCPCMSCLVKVICNEACKDILDYCNAYERTLNENQHK